MRGVFDQTIPHDKVLLGQLETTIKNFDPGITRPVKKTDHNSFSNPLLFFKDSLRNLNFFQSYPQYDSVEQRIFNLFGFSLTCAWCPWTDFKYPALEYNSRVLHVDTTWQRASQISKLSSHPSGFKTVKFRAVKLSNSLC